MASLAPAAPPDLGGGAAVPPPSPPAPPPAEDDDIGLPPALVIPPISVTLPMPASPPESSSSVIPAPLSAPPLPVVVIGATPPPTLSPPSPAPPQPQPGPRPPLASPPLPKEKPTPIRQSPAPNTVTSPPSPNSKDKPISVTLTPPPIPSSATTKPSSQPPKGAPTRRPGTRPGPSRPGPTRPKKGNGSAALPPTKPLPASAILPTPPPLALPVPQAPGGGAWLPFTSESPAPLPTLPGPPVAGGQGSPAAPLYGSTSGASSSSSSTGVVASGGDHQNIEAKPGPGGRGDGSGGFVVGLCVAGVLLLLLGAVVGILVVFCRRRERKLGGGGSGKMQGKTFTGFAEKTSLPQHTKQQGSNTTGYQALVSANSPLAHISATNGPTTPPLGPASGGTFTYGELAGATNGFSEANLLGQGGFGYVHKGVLPNGKEVAVKQLKLGGHQGEREFQAEVETISQVHHKHLVSLVGFCIAGAERLLVYEFVPNNTLDFHLHEKGHPVMDWPTRLKIAIGSAKGLAYLHEDCSPTIIHRDIKAANILLDFNFEAKVSDFGLAKIFSSANSSVTHITTRVVGTFGYLAPEYASSGKVTDKSDVYSYGVVLLELITGHPPISSSGSATNGSLVNWARPLLAQAISSGNFESLADPKLQDNYDVDEMASMVACAAACVRLSAWRRPKMSQVVHALEGNLSASELDDGTRPGDSSMHFPYESLDFDARHYIEDMRRMALTSNHHKGYTTTTNSSRHSNNTSDYGLHLSASSTSTTHRG